MPLPSTPEETNWGISMAGALDTYPRRDLAEYFLIMPAYFQLYHI